MRMIFLFILALAVGGPAVAAERWPTLEFEVYEGYGPPLNSEGGIFLARQAGLEHLDVPAPMKTPLAPALKAEMEAYLSEVAARYQRLGFPPPELEPIVTRADGKRAYRVYWYAFGDTAHMAGESKLPAVMAYACRGEPNTRRLNLNARVDGANSLQLRLAQSTGKVPGRLDRLTDKGYGDLAHELFHAVQRGTRLFDNHCEPPDWITEGTAEAIGHDMAWTLRGVVSPRSHEQVNRWGLRSYQRTFAVTDEGARKFGYGTSSFWRYLAELEQSLQSRSAPPPRPDATPLARTGAVDYGYLARMLADAGELGGSRDHRAWLDWLDRWLGGDARLRLGFERAYPDFLTVFADYGRQRVTGQQSERERLDKVQEITLGGCHEYRLDLSAPVSLAPARVALAANGAGCLRLVRADAGTEPLLVDARTLVTERSAPDLNLGVAGQTRAMRPVIAKDASGKAVASWALVLEPGAALDLVFSNVHEEPSKSRAIHIDVGFAISGWQFTGPPPPRSAPRQRTVKPAARREQSKAVQQGPGAARLQRETTSAPDGRCVWPYPDAALHCGPTMQVILRRLPRWMAWQDAALDPDEADLASEGTLLAYTAARSGDALEALDQTQVRIRLPQLDHGFTGTINNVLIVVSGGEGPDWVSRGPADSDRGPMNYYAASGQVRIDHYDEIEMRGAFQGQLVEEPPGGVLRDRPLAVVASVSGTFVLGRPWEGDDRYEGVVPDLDVLFSEIADQLPGSLRTDARFAPPAISSEAPEGGGPGSGASAGAAGTACDCSCKGKSELLEYLEAMDEDATPTMPQLAKAMCMIQCQAAYSACPEA